MAQNNSINAPTPIAIAKGGTGQTAKTAAFDALSPLTTKGDLVAHNGTNNVRMPIGIDGTVLIASSAQANGMQWLQTNLLNSNTINTTPQAMSANNSYITNNGVTQVVYTLPATATVGSYIQIVGFSSGGWQLAQNSGQTIHFPAQDTTTGTGGSVTSGSRYSSLLLICTATNTDFVVLSSTGILTVV